MYQTKRKSTKLQNNVSNKKEIYNTTKIEIYKITKISIKQKDNNHSTCIQHFNNLLFSIFPKQIDRDAACESTKSCFPSPSDCSTNCDYLVSWQTSGTDDVQFTLRRKTTSNNHYIAIGFSDNLSMVRNVFFLFFAFE